MTPQSFLFVVMSIATVIVVAALIMVLWRAVTTHNDARRAVLSDAIFLCMAALFMCYSIYDRTAVTFEVAMFAGFFGALSTAAYARIISRGRR
ncbi:monovalent cation/H+ antiporter complex subunit F [Corynebacterium suicordis]|uniref:Cation:proton antiporter n=1 Tax=Corynebacterium suicordis DSM 45110 TaxID=1121369 RepID=A0ABR9ZJ59_9CORY|nr:monovalent cation/H+ antiporter complex subunit F [Corynebacterium suicordis]MBF4552687.1 cation:proton antiporter [Corynebacterium suicordis DSM 45110]MDR6278354.1 multicomponent Na+:H+ antiporter subunit F [Corynebacterium suicordis]